MADEEIQQQAIKEILRRRAAEANIVSFAEIYLSHHLKYKTPEFHKEIYSLLNENRLAIAAPRSFAKSTIVQVIYGMWLLLCQKNRDIVTISASGTLAEDWVRKIKLELETNELIRSDFDHLVWGKDKSKKWTEGHITLDSPDGKIVNQLRARGRGCQIRGFRPTNVLCDDLEDDELVLSSEQRSKLRQWFLGALLNTIDMRQQLIVIGTILHPLALLNEIIGKKEEFREWETRKFKAITDNKSIWEEKWPLEELLKKKAESGTYKFQAEYQNEPLAGEEQLIKPHWVKKWEILPRNLTKFLLIDPAISTKEGADETGMVVLGLSEDSKIYEVESISGKWGVWEILDNLITLYKKHEPLKIGIEAIAYQQVLKPILLKEARLKGYYLPIQNITLGTYKAGQKGRKEPKDKFTRALGITHLFEQELVFLKSQKLIEQCLLFPTGDRDDLFDALVYGLHMIMKHARGTGVFKDNSENFKKEVNSFEIKDNTIPAFIPEEEFWKGKKDWKITG